MSVFIELTTDAFQEKFDQRKKDARDQRKRAGANDVRRPMRGLEIKDDTYAILKVVTSDGNEIKLINSSVEGGRSSEYTNFILQSVQEARMEKHQIVETFGESYIFFFGEAPRFLDVQAVLVDSHDFNWYAEFWENYENYFRGTKLVEMGARTYLFYDDNIVEGYMLNAQAVKTSTTPLMVTLSFRMYLTNYSNISIIGDPSFPVRGSLVLPPDTDVNALDKDRGAYLATLGANLQQAGFGGGSQFQQAFASGANASGVPPELWGIFVNASEALGDGTKHPERFQRSGPLRGDIFANTDEYTSPRPTLDTGANKDAIIQDEVENLVAQAMQMLQQLGARQNPPSLAEQNAEWARRARGLGPNMMQQMGLGPRFGGGGVGVGFGGGGGVGASFGVRASFGVSFGASAGAGFRGGAGGGMGGGIGGGIGGGLGFSGRASAGFGLNGGFGRAPFSPNATIANNYQYSKRSAALNQLNQASFAQQGVDFNFFDSFRNSQNYSNGVQTGGGIMLGVGIGGGIGRPFGVQTFSGPGQPGFFGPGVQPAVGLRPGDPGYDLLVGSGIPGFGPQPGGGFSFSFQVGDPPPSGYGYNPYGSPYGPGYGPGPANFGVPGAPPGASFGGPGNGGGSVNVGGSPTAFSMVSVGGSLTPNGFNPQSSSFSYSTF
jgi:hypothetical protein